MQENIVTQENIEQGVLDLEEVEKFLDEELTKKYKREGFYFFFDNDKEIFIIYPYMDYIKIGKHKDTLMEYFSNKREHKKKNIYIISGHDIKNGKNRWFKLER